MSDTLTDAQRFRVRAALLAPEGMMIPMTQAEALAFARAWEVTENFAKAAKQAEAEQAAALAALIDTHDRMIGHIAVADAAVAAAEKAQVAFGRTTVWTMYAVCLTAAFLQMVLS